MWKGHGRKIKAGLRSTREAIKQNVLANKDVEINESDGAVVAMAVYDLQEDLVSKMYTDQTGRFPVQSWRGYQYIMVLDEIKSNIIMVEPMQDRTTGEMSRAYKEMVLRLKSQLSTC